MGLRRLRRVNTRKILIEKTRWTYRCASVSNLLAKCWKHGCDNSKQDS
jgi:hypothetical protein